MDVRFISTNLHLTHSGRFSEVDPQLSYLKKLTYVYQPSILKNMLVSAPGIYTLVGGGKTGKTTLIKQIIQEMLSTGTIEKNILVLNGDLIKNYHDLTEVLITNLQKQSLNEVLYIFIDDVLRVRHFEKAIKTIVVNNLLSHAVLWLISADKVILNLLQQTVPQVLQDHFQLCPLTFKEVLTLKYPEKKWTDINLAQELDEYLWHGGYLMALNDMAMHGKILDSTLTELSTWLINEMTAQGKNVDFVREIISGILQQHLHATTWNQFAKSVSINHPKTIGDYVLLLNSLGIVFIQFSLLENELTAAPKKARRLLFSSPFVFHALSAWINPKKNYFTTNIKPCLEDPLISSELAKSCAVTHYARCFKTYYIKAEGEIDLAYINEGRFWPILVTWSKEMQAKDLKQILKYQNGKILTKTPRSGIIEHMRTEPLMLSLLKLG